MERFRLFERASDSNDDATEGRSDVYGVRDGTLFQLDFDADDAGATEPASALSVAETVIDNRGSDRKATGVRSVANSLGYGLRMSVYTNDDAVIEQVGATPDLVGTNIEVAGENTYDLIVEHRYESSTPPSESIYRGWLLTKDESERQWRLPNFDSPRSVDITVEDGVVRLAGTATGAVRWGYR